MDDAIKDILRILSQFEFDGITKILIQVNVQMYTNIETTIDRIMNYNHTDVNTDDFNTYVLSLINDYNYKFLITRLKERNYKNIDHIIRHIENRYMRYR
jgi:hypothetical protein